MTIDETRNIFGFAADQKTSGDLEGANRTFLQTVLGGVPEGVVVVLQADDDEKPTDLVAWRQTRPHHFAVLVLELEGEVSQTIPVPILDELGGLELVDGLIAVSRYECSGWNDDVTDDERAYEDHVEEVHQDSLDQELIRSFEG